jgi:hypothetical protein
MEFYVACLAWTIGSHHSKAHGSFHGRFYQKISRGSVANKVLAVVADPRALAFYPRPP